MHREHSLQQAKDNQPRRNRRLGLTRVDLSVPLFIAAAFGAAIVSAMGIAAWDYASSKDFHAVPLLLFFPAFLFAIIQRHWMSLPLWACFLAISWVGLSRPRSLMEPYHHRYYLFLLLIVLLTEFARLIRGYKRR